MSSIDKRVAALERIVHELDRSVKALISERNAEDSIIENPNTGRFALSHKEKPRVAYNMGSPRVRLDPDVYETLAELADARNRTCRETASILLRWALSQTDEEQ